MFTTTFPAIQALIVSNPNFLLVVCFVWLVENESNWESSPHILGAKRVKKALKPQPNIYPLVN